ncbi:MAG: MBOAT family protein [Lachnospiraceae bacterium]|nr:MBOAT family protein [Lachnospiraceae bacterium]
MATNVMLTLCFLAAALAVYYIIPAGKRWAWLLLCSYVFYMSVDPRMALLLGGSSLWTWFAGLGLERETGERRRRVWLWAGCAPLLGFLFLFKYLDFFVQSAAKLLGITGVHTLGLVMPLGISYYTFKLLSYLFEIKRGNLEAERHPGYLLVYTSFFPQILSGPIERPGNMLPRLRSPRYEGELFNRGLQRMILGLFKKMVIANRLAVYVDQIFADPAGYPALAAWMAAFFYSIQIYCDFSGYSDLALGMSDCMGIPCRENFSLPYFSAGIREFWSRWHISLSSWLRDYVYIPLGGSRCSRARRNRNLMLTFLVSGLWHGDNWTFVLWGGLHGLWNMAGKKAKPDRAWKRLVSILGTFAGVTLCWIFFRAESVSQAFGFLKRMITGFSLDFASLQAAVLPFSGDNTCAALLLTVCGCILLLFVYELQRHIRERRKQDHGEEGRDKDGKSGGKEAAVGSDAAGLEILTPAWTVIFLLTTILLGVFGNSAFLYAQF